MNYADFTLSTFIYIGVFTGCYCYFTWELPLRHNRVVSYLVLAATLAFSYTRTISTLETVLIRYLILALLYTLWSLAFLRISPYYALYLAMFFTIFMGVWISCSQIVLYTFEIRDALVTTVVTGLCRIISIIVLKRRFIHVDAMRTITIHELWMSLFPAAALFVANLEVYDYLNRLSDLGQTYNVLLIHGSVVFFGFAAMLVLLESESYFHLIHYREESEKAQNQLNAQYQLFLKEKEAGEQLRAFRHDLRNHLDTIAALSSSKDVQTYIASLRESAQRTEPLFSTGNMTVDALLSIKQPLLRERGIELTCLIHFSGADFLTPMELCRLFSNSIDNAIDAVTSADFPKSRRWIRVSGGEVNGNLVVRVENPYSNALINQGGRLSTTKADTSLHGYGLANMQRIVDAHNGTLTFKAEHDIFTLFWMIPISK